MKCISLTTLKGNSGIKSLEIQKLFKRTSNRMEHCDTYKKYFPQVKNGSDLKNTARILSQGWGSAS